MFTKILVANRGEIALRIIRACKELGIQSVAVHSTADANAMHVRMADEAICIGPPPSSKSYLSFSAIVSACSVANVDAVHPGYGFLSENPAFAQILEDHGICFIGPSAEHVRRMGDKIAAKKTMAGLNVPCVPGSEGSIESFDRAKRVAADIGYPVIVKAAAGGGGRGMRVASSQTDLENAFLSARGEALAAFGSDAVYIEKYLKRPRHVEVQVIGDGNGGAVHLGERDCSLQRRHQKILEEAPGPSIDSDLRHAIGMRCAEAAAALGYAGAGTIEFLFSEGEFHFIEMNTRLQVEHPITEAVFGVDIVREQIRVAAGLPLSFAQEELAIRGHAIEARINAEAPPDFRPSPGRVTAFHAPGGPGIRMDTAIYTGYEIPPWYDSLVGKVIVHSTDRSSALAKLAQALDELIVDGIQHTVPLFQRLLGERDITNGNYDIHWLEKWLENSDWQQTHLNHSAG